MDPVAVSYYPPETERVVTHDVMVSVTIIRVQGKTCGGSEGVVNILTEFPEVTEIASRRGLGV